MDARRQDDHVSWIESRVSRDAKKAYENARSSNICIVTIVAMEAETHLRRSDEIPDAGLRT